jgi:hypothetical protein
MRLFWTSTHIGIYNAAVLVTSPRTLMNNAEPAAKPAVDGTTTGPLTLSGYFRFQHIRDQLEKEGVKIPIPAGN